ncbi:DUF4293 domain-containing protein [Odoribacter lunatus]|uniref:DUF4293 domain-containing protein n=1 Tax=Odoribacter lunatus TaxID=2941335 RepID=UPI00203F3B36|nr:DUF4293 domain-containing protein [Odoribacter lunatus]
MIQRIQSVYLFLTVVFTALLFFMPVAYLTIPEAPTYEFYTTQVIQSGTPKVFIACNWMSMVLNIVITLLSAVIIFLYKKRFLQLRLCVVNIILLIGLLILMWLQIARLTDELHAVRQWGFSFGFPLIGVILNWLAIRGIIKDIALLKSYDRIR